MCLVTFETISDRLQNKQSLVQVFTVELFSRQVMGHALSSLIAFENLFRQVMDPSNPLEFFTPKIRWLWFLTPSHVFLYFI
jgi:hypothetical protein